MLTGWLGRGTNINLQYEMIGSSACSVFSRRGTPAHLEGQRMSSRSWVLCGNMFSCFVFGSEAKVLSRMALHWSGNVDYSDASRIPPGQGVRLAEKYYGI